MDSVMPGEPASSSVVRAGEPLYGGRFRCSDGPSLPLVLPGELIAGVDEDGFPRVLEASAQRVEPGCEHFRRCGGCHYQHADYAQQLAWKAGVLERLLADAQPGPLPPAQYRPRIWAAEPWGYRNRIRLRVEAGAEAFEAGYSRAGSNQFLPIRMCPIAAPLLWRAAQALLSHARHPAGARWLAALAEVELFCLPDESRLLMTLLLREAASALGQPAALAELCTRMQALVPELCGAGAELHPDLSRRARRGWNGAQWGAEGLRYPAGDETYWVPRGAFFQVNRLLVERMVSLVCEGRQGSLAWDLYAGVGLFTKVLARRFERVIAVEGGQEAYRGLQAAGRGARGSAAIEVLQMAVMDFLRARVLERERPELIVLDPPRAGLGVEGAELLGRIAAARVVYVSCDPVTLARDLAVLTQGGYRVTALDLVDMFPQTYHIETVVQLEPR